MSNLPPEILHSIFIRLGLKQRLECLSVCRSWWKALDSYSLFHSVIIRETKQLNTFMDAFERLPQYASQVEELGLEGQITVDFSKRNIFATFPNVRRISVERHSTHSDRTFRHVKKHIGNTRSKSKLEYLSDFKHCALTCQMLSLELGDRLETLELDFYYLKSPWPNFSQLKKLPVLKKLYLSRPHIKIDDIENIHCNIPSIQDLGLSSITLLAGTVPSDIAPATCVTKLEFSAQRHADSETCAHLYQYMAKKYTNIKQAEYSDDGLNYYNFNQRKHVYFNGILEFIKMVASKQSRVLLQCVPDDVDAFRAFDAGDSQIKELLLFGCGGKTIFQYLGQSKQAEYINGLYIEDSIVDEIHPLKNMTCLTSMHIGYEDSYDTRVNLADCLAACPPTLNSLTIKNADMFVLPFRHQLESIEYLNLNRVNINSNMGDIIPNSLPNLIELDLGGTVGYNTHIKLKNPHFRRAVFTIGNMDDYKDKRYGFSFKCPNMPKTQYYSCSYDNTTQVDRGDLRGLPLLSVESLTEKKSEGGECGIFIS